MNALVLLVALAADPAPLNVEYQMYGGVQTGLPFVFGATGRLSVVQHQKPAWDLDFHWEPSAWLQSYSVGVTWRPLRGLWGLTARGRVVTFGAPWSKGTTGADTHVGPGLETVWRWPLLQDRLVISLAAQVTWLPSQAANLQWLPGLNLSAEWRFWRVEAPRAEEPTAANPKPGD